MFVADHHTLEQLQDLAQAMPQQRLWRRVHAVILAQQGRTAQDSALAQIIHTPEGIASTGSLRRCISRAWGGEAHTSPFPRAMAALSGSSRRDGGACLSR
jgi:hypothetical protein